MKNLLLIVITSIVFLVACTKTALPSPASANSITAADAALVQAKSRTTILTAHPWKYQGYYFHYVDSTNKGEPQYIRGGDSNLVALDNTRFTFQINGTFIEKDNGYNYPGTWYFTNAADTTLVMTYSWGTNVNAIINLNIKHLNYKKPIGSYSHNNFAYSELIPAQ